MCFYRHSNEHGSGDRDLPWQLLFCVYEHRRGSRGVVTFITQGLEAFQGYQTAHSCPVNNPLSDVPRAFNSPH